MRGGRSSLNFLIGMVSKSSLKGLKRVKKQAVLLHSRELRLPVIASESLTGRLLVAD